MRVGVRIVRTRMVRSLLLADVGHKPSHAAAVCRSAVQDRDSAVASGIVCGIDCKKTIFPGGACPPDAISYTLFWGLTLKTLQAMVSTDPLPIPPDSPNEAAL
jgi:hypothetical protein